MTLQHRRGDLTGEDVEDLRTWLGRLDGAPEVHERVVLGCSEHADERPRWAYVEADPRHGVARRRCVACAHVVYTLDSDHRWTHPVMWSCAGCGQSIAEVAAGLSMPDGEHVDWLVLGGRCVECGRLAGLTDFVVEHRPLSEVLAQL